MQFDKTPHHDRGKHEDLPKVPSEFRVMVECLRTFKAFAQSPDWGHPRGVPAYILQSSVAAERHPARFKQLGELFNRFLDSLERWVAQSTATPLQTVELLRATQWSDSFASIAAVLRQVDRTRPHSAAEEIQRFERVAYSLARSTMAGVTHALERLDNEGLADEWRDLVRRLEPEHGVEIQVDGIALGSTTEFLPLVYAVRINPKDPRAPMIQRWIEERQEQRNTLDRLLQDLGCS